MHDNMGDWPHKFTDEDRAKARQSRWALMSPEDKRAYMMRLALTRWYKITAEDSERIDRMLIALSRQVASAMLEEDRRGVIVGISAMVPLERIKIMLRQGSMRDVTPGSPIEGQSEIETKLQQASERRRKSLSEPSVETTSTKVEE
jgi:hypothetical protein